MKDNFVGQYAPIKILRYVVNSQVTYTVTHYILIIHNNNLFNSQVTNTATHNIFIIHNNNLFNFHSFIKSWLFGMQQFSFNPTPFKNNNKQ